MRKASTITIFWVMLIASPFVFLANPFCGVLGTDSSIFVYVGRCVGRSLIPYRDVFDQKGPLIYALDWLGCSFGGVLGLWVLDCTCLFCAVFLFLLFIKTSACFLNSSKNYGCRFDDTSYVALALSIVFFHLSACGGNMPEMWIVFLSAITWLLVAQSVLHTRLSGVPAVAMGVCIGGIALLKFNMMAVTLPVGIVALLDGGDRKSTFKKRIVNCCFVALGVAVVLTPVVAWFGCKGALGDMWDVYVVYNALYASVLRSMRGGLAGYMGRLFWPVLLVVLANVYMIYEAFSKRCAAKSEWRLLVVLNILFLCAAFGLVLFSGGSHRYYGPILPACVMPIWYMLTRIDLRSWFATVIMAGCLLLVCGLAFVRNKGDAKSQYVHLREMGAEVGLVGSESVMVLGCDCYAYWILDAWCPTRFPFQGTIGYCSPEYRTQIIKDIVSGKAEWLIEPRGVLDIEGALGVSWAKDTVNSRYNLVASNESYGIWRRKEIQAIE